MLQFPHLVSNEHNELCFIILHRNILSFSQILVSVGVNYGQSPRLWLISHFHDLNFCLCFVTSDHKNFEAFTLCNFIAASCNHLIRNANLKGHLYHSMEMMISKCLHSGYCIFTGSCRLQTVNLVTRQFNVTQKLQVVHLKVAPQINCSCISVWFKFKL